MNNLDHMGLRPLSLSDRPLIDRILSSEETMLSAYAFVSHYIWRDIFHYYWDIMDDYFCLFARYDDYLYMPVPPVPCRISSLENNPIPTLSLPLKGREFSSSLKGGNPVETLMSQELTKEQENVIPAEAGIQNAGRGLDSHLRGNDGHLEGFSDEKLRGILIKAFSLMQAINKNSAVSRIENIDESQAETFLSMGYTLKSGEGEYVYLREDLANLKGDPYKSKRAMCNHFIKNYSYSYEPFHARFADDCIRLYEVWKERKRERAIDAFSPALLEDASLAHQQAIRQYEALQLTGRVVRINNRVEGYLFGFKRRGDIFCILLEITNSDIRGLAQFIFREFCREREMENFRYINTLGDSGLETLRRVKLSYRPLKIVPSYIACLP